LAGEGLPARAAAAFCIMQLRLLIFSLALTVAAAPRAFGVDAKVEFNRDVRPILADTCFKCHGPDKAARKAELRLDVRDEAVAPRQGEGHVVPIVPGDPKRSDVWRRISTTDKSDLMPPPDSHLALSDKQKETLRKWIEQGAEYQPHWAFLPVKDSSPPATKRGDWARNSIDAFVLARLESEGLEPAKEADRHTLIRRVTFDLTGLPPTPAEVEAFVNDASPNAYDNVVDRLLASPAYGERMTMDWLDEARYADTHGFNNDTMRYMWRWRDWVIDAFNANKPYNAFVTEQLAGDLLPNSTVDQKVATGFLRNQVLNSEGGIIDEEYRIEYAVERTVTTGNVLLGLTLQCARCHDHKYDPVSQKEFYSLLSFFNQLNEKGEIPRTEDSAPVIKSPTREQTAELAKIAADVAALEKSKQERAAVVDATWVAWEPTLRESMKKQQQTPTADGLLVYFKGDGGKKFAGEVSFGSGTGDFERTDKFSIGAWVKPERLDGPGMAVVAKMDDANSSRGYDLILAEGGKPEAHVIHAWPANAIRVIAKQPLTPGMRHHVFATYDGSSKVAGLNIYVDGVNVEVERTHDTLKDTAKTTVPLKVGGRSASLPFAGAIEDVRVYTRELKPDEVKTLGTAPDTQIIEALAVAPDKRTPPQKMLLREHYLRTLDPAYLAANVKLTELRKREVEANKSVSTVMVMQEMSPPRKTFVLKRGAYDAPAEEVQPGVPAALPPMSSDAPKNRLGLARWLTSSNHPLTSRVAVNRYWYQYFGVGIVKTLEDWGVQGEPPSHPELLDWLASDFVKSGWDVKALQKLIVTSATYRQAARYDPTLLDKDPENRLLARGPRGRLAAEMIRDNALSLAGLLVQKIGGPSVMPYQPPGLWEDVVVGADLPGTVYKQVHGPDLYRRGMYTFWKRTAPPPALNTFDAPEREFCTIRRPQTNTPLQALVLMNDPTFTEASRKIAERMMREGGNSRDERIKFAFNLATDRPANPEELKVLCETFDRRLYGFRAKPDAAKKLLVAGESKHDEKLDASELAAYTTVASMILNLDETITK
jgi:hypothetical protein